MTVFANLLMLTIAQAAPGQAGEPARNVVVRWNEIALQSVRSTRTPPPKCARALAMTHVAVYEAVNAIVGTHEAYLLNVTPAPGSSAEAAAVAAAHGVLRELFPQDRDRLDKEYVQDMRLLSRDPGRDTGVDLGRFVAERVLDWRRGDGSERGGQYEPRNKPGFWSPTAPGQQALLPGWGHVGAFAIRKGTQHEPPRPPALSSDAYAKAFNEVKLLGERDSLIRTPDQTQIAHFWADDAGTVTPPGHWNRIAQSYAMDRRLDLVASARLFALMNMSLSDAGMLCWILKFTHEFWRPVTGIRQADQDDNPATEKEERWTPLLNTPPFPAYTSGHSTFSAAAAGVLTHFHGSDTYEFSTTSDDLPGVTRSFRSFKAAAEEAGMSRIYGGIHWQFDNVEGLKTGQVLADYVVRNYLRPRARVVARPAFVFEE